MTWNFNSQGGISKLSSGSMNADFQPQDSDVVITGLGIVSPIGIGREAVWESLREKKTGVSFRPQWSESPLRFAATVDATFDPRQYIKPRKSLKVMCREIQLGVAAAGIAVEDSGIQLEQFDPFRIGVVLGTDIMYCPPEELAETYEGCLINGEFDFQRWFEQTQRKLNPLFMLKYLPNMAASHVAIAQNAQGPCNTLVMGEISGVLSLIEAADVIASGRADVMLAGGSGCSVNETAIVYQGTDRLTPISSESVCRPAPFDLHRDGTVIGEGAGIVVLERRANAVRRGAKIYASLAGYSRGMQFRPQPGETTALEFALNDALRKSGFRPSDLDHVNATGQASQTADRLEAMAIQKVVGDCPVVAPSSYFGKLNAASSMVEMLVSLVAADQGFRAATLNYTTPDESCPVQVATDVTPLTHPAFIKLASTETGQTAGIITRLEN
jgi:3-oxoacyl-[acyl-carrier-protein] synthase II